MFFVVVGISMKGGLRMSNTMKTNVARTNFWTTKSNYVFRRSVQSFLHPQKETKVMANTECESGCNNSCGTACASGCTDF